MSKSKELYTTTELVKKVLEKEPKARCSDNYLYLRVLQITGQQHGIDIDNMRNWAQMPMWKRSGC